MKRKGDWYMKFILTVIAVLLFGLLIKPSVIPERVEADPGERVYVENSLNNPIPVKIVSGSVNADISGSVEVFGKVKVENDYRTPLYIRNNSTTPLYITE